MINNVYQEDVVSKKTILNEETEKDMCFWTKCGSTASIEEKKRRLCRASLDEIAALDKDIEKAIFLFFSNQVKDAEDILLTKATFDPFAALGVGCISSAKGILSFAQSDISAALKMIESAIALALDVIHSRSNSSGNSESSGDNNTIGDGSVNNSNNYWRSYEILRYFWKNTKNNVPIWIKFRSKAILAFAYALQGLLLFIEQDSFKNLLKSGLVLKKCYNTLTSLMKELDLLKKKRQSDSYDNLDLDRNSVYAVILGCGCANIVLSCLPPYILRVLNFLGFSHNRARGVDMVLKVINSNTVLSPFAGLFLIFIDTVLSGFCPIIASSCILSVKEMTKKSMEQSFLKNSFFHLWLLGRIFRLEKKIDKSIDAFSKCIEVADKGQITKHMPMLLNIVLYDQAWNCLCTSRWEECILTYKKLEENMKIFKIFYVYAQACCYEILVHEVKATNPQLAQEYREKITETYWRAAHYSVSHLHGRALIIESLVANRLNEIFSYCNVAHPNPGNTKVIDLSKTMPPNNAMLKNIVVMPILELLVMFDMIHQMPEDIVYKIFQFFEEITESGTANTLDLKSTVVDNEENKPGSFFANKKNCRYDNSAVLMTFKAILLSNIKDRREEGRDIIQHVLHIANKHKRQKSTLAWITPWLLHEEACQCFADCNYAKSKELLRQIDNLHLDEVVGPAVETKLHFVKYIFCYAEESYT